MNLKDKNENTFNLNPLRRSASTTGLCKQFEMHINLRDTKSYIIDPEDISDISEDHDLENNKAEEPTTDKHFYELRPAEIETKDSFTNEIVKVRLESLICKEKRYTLDDVAHTWKKDYRMWLWKNDFNFKKSMSLGFQIKSGLKPKKLF